MRLMFVCLVQVYLEQSILKREAFQYTCSFLLANVLKLNTSSAQKYLQDNTYILMLKCSGRSEDLRMNSNDHRCSPRVTVCLWAPTMSMANLLTATSGTGLPWTRSLQICTQWDSRYLEDINNLESTLCPLFPTCRKSW